MTLRLAPEVLADLSDEETALWDRIRAANARADAKLKKVERDKRRTRAKLRPALRADPRAVHESEAPNKRQPRIRDAAYLAWLRTLPCVRCATLGRLRSPCEAAHVRFSDAGAGRRNPGTSAKPSDRFAVPLCGLECHREGKGAQHRAGDEQRWWRGLGVDVAALMRDLSEAYDAREDGSAVVLRHAGARRDTAEAAE